MSVELDRKVEVRNPEKVDQKRERDSAKGKGEEGEGFVVSAD